MIINGIKAQKKAKAETTSPKVSVEKPVTNPSPPHLIEPLRPIWSSKKLQRKIRKRNNARKLKEIESIW